MRHTRRTRIVPCAARALAAALLAVAACAAAHAQAAPLLLDAAARPDVDLARHVSVAFDESLAANAAQMRAAPQRFQPVESRYIDFGLTDARVWLRATVANGAPEPAVWRLDLRRQYLTELEVYVARGGAPPELLLSHAEADPFNRRPIPDRYLAVDVPFAGHEQVELMIAYRSPTTTWMPMRLATPAAYAAAHAREDQFNQLMNGALIAMAAIALLMTPVIGWRVSASFCLYLVAGGLFVFHAEGYTFQHLWPGRPGLNEPLGLTFMLGLALAAPLFARALFDTPARAPRLDRALRVVIAVAFGLIVLSVPLFRFTWFLELAYPFVLIAVAAHVTVAVWAYRTRALGAVPFLVGAGLIVFSFAYAAAAHLAPGHMSLERTLDVGHANLLSESLAFAAAITARMVGLRRERDAALRAELAAARDKLKLDADLREAQARYDRARREAERRRDQLSSVGHDIRQPLAALRAAVARLADTDVEAARQVIAAFDYLETLARRQVAPQPAAASSEVEDEGDEAEESACETFPVSAVLDNVRAMFANEAAAKGLAFRYRPSPATARSDPIALMRLVNNLVANAIKHTETGGVLLAARRRGDAVSIEIWDTGPGMDDATLARALERYEKGASSTGDGLGLAIVWQLAAPLGVTPSIRSKPGAGTVARLLVPTG